ncbi:phosphatase PAP2 family protein [Burkholderia pyrrocinia]|uniref:phosphatase PAP2 family protein n=1 Tax=Burkholderia pyrrocinia TaxID=60550 RepID=UPI00157725CC|nr:phosphatase PAP2 family protein [Burkholderia pyrrocinia]NTX28275.1 phosphatase PAP2 family protein [Burkholderia pyrrocinia]
MKNRNAAIYAASWGAIIIVAIVDFEWAKRTGFTIGHGWPFSFVKELCIVFGVALGLIGVAALPRYRALAHMLRCREFAATLFCLMTFAVWGQTASITSYLGIGLNVTSIADPLVRFDRAIGFDWVNAYHWVAAHPILKVVFKYAYYSAFAQLVAFPVILAIARRPDDIAEFLAILFGSSILLMLISIPFPAESAFIHYGISDPGTVGTVSDFTALRNGTLRSINPYAVQGLVSLPSFHTMLAIFFIYSMRHVRFVFPFAIVLNAVMIASTVTVGGHYLADVLAGGVCGAVLLWCAAAALRRMPMVRDEINIERVTSGSGGAAPTL